jgi:hypothetical protein
MSEKKVVGRNVAIALGVITIILLIGLVGAMVNYTTIINNKDATYQNYVSTHSNSNSAYDSLNSEYQYYISNHSHSNSEYDSMWTSYLIKVDLKASDNRPWLSTPYLRVYGYMCNVNQNWAYNCKLHVVAYQSGGVVAIDTHVDLGTIIGESWTHVDSNVYYSGSGLISWTITPEWTS